MKLILKHLKTFDFSDSNILKNLKFFKEKIYINIIGGSFANLSWKYCNC